MIREIETSFFNASFYSEMFKASSKSKAGNKIRTLQSRGNLDLSIKQELRQVHRLWNFIVDNELCCISVYLYDLVLLFVYVVKQQFASWKYESKSNVSMKMRYQPQISE